MRTSDFPTYLISTMEHISDCSYQVQAWLRVDPQAPEFLHLGNFSSLIVQHLVKYLGRRTPPFDPVIEAMAIALLMFTVRMTNDPTSPVDSLHFAATAWLRHSLVISRDMAWDPDLRLWVCAIGAICAQGSRDASDIEQAFIHACREWGIGTLEQLVETLESLLWIRSRFDSYLGKVWERTRSRIVVR